uniref:NADH-ubiquinone oxidoreductase chain 4L n=1 Tax=Eualetes tulipa TaxID=765164 RepID=E2FLU0_9CAEN|nr:NADH dehydrogenase subunit 4L [Eualetes tulipa]ADI79406.1 NADH dehydrogenase subunit 4L [Eualetes tulipa]
MSLYYLCVCVVGLAGSVAALMLQHKHLLGALLSLEAALMNLFVLLFCYSSGFLGCYSSLIFIALSACEASMGLAVLVSLVRSHGNDYVSSFTSQGC